MTATKLLVAFGSLLTACYGLPADDLRIYYYDQIEPVRIGNPSPFDIPVVLLDMMVRKPIRDERPLSEINEIDETEDFFDDIRTRLEKITKDLQEVTHELSALKGRNQVGEKRTESDKPATDAHATFSKEEERMPNSLEISLDRFSKYLIDGVNLPDSLHGETNDLKETTSKSEDSKKNEVASSEIVTRPTSVAGSDSDDSSSKAESDELPPWINWLFGYLGKR